MDLCNDIDRRARARRHARGSAARAAALAALAVAASLPACRGVTEIVLVVDTDLTVPVDLDRIDVDVAGSLATPTISVDLTAPGVGAFPLTLGLTPAGSPGPVTVTVTGWSQNKPVVAQQAGTDFVEGSQRMLRMLLLRSCAGTTCATGDSCGAGGCASATRPGSALPPWTGALPERPVLATTLPIGGRTVWCSGWHSCAVEARTLYCWGQNSDGEIGNDSTRNANVRRPVMNLPDPAAVGLGAFVTCICDRAGKAWCWGRNVEGELGIGATSMNAQVPTQVPGVTDCSQIAGGAQHVCILRQSGGVSCWGSNGSGQSGQPPAATPVLTSPTPVPGLADVAEIRAGEKYSCARKNDMTVVCWGDNGFGQLGDGTTTAHAAPGAVTGLGTDIVELATGRFSACARHATGRVSCWGQNDYGQLGNGASANSGLPVDVGGLSDAAQLAVGLVHACALRRTGVVSCWGGNMNGQLGVGTTISAPALVDVKDLTQVTSIAAGSVHTCARHATGLACWGENVVNQLGDGTTTERWSPVSVAGFL